MRTVLLSQAPSRRVRDGLADVISMHEMLTNQILLFHSETVATPWLQYARQIISYIPQTEQHEPEGRMLFHLGNVTNLLDVTPKNSIPHPLSPPPILFMLFKVKDLVAK